MRRAAAAEEAGPSGRNNLHHGYRTQQRGEDDEMGVALHTTLQLLGLDVKAHREYAEVVLGPAMFKKPNPRGLEIVLFNVLRRIEGKDAVKKVLKGCWPPRDSEQQKAFRKAMAAWLAALADKGRLPAALAASAPTLLQSGSGQRLTELLCHVAAAALLQAHAAHVPGDEPLLWAGAVDPPQDAALAPERYPTAIRVASARCAAEARRFAQRASQVVAEQEEWGRVAAGLALEHRRLLAERQQLLAERDQRAATSAAADDGTNHPSDALQENEGQQQQQQQQAAGMMDGEERCAAAVAEARRAWQVLGCSLEGASRLREVAQHALSGRHPYAINGAELAAAAAAAAALAAGGSGDGSSGAGAVDSIAGFDIVDLLKDLTAAVDASRQGIHELATRSALVGGSSTSSSSTTTSSSSNARGQGQAEGQAHGEHLGAALATVRAHISQQRAMQVELARRLQEADARCAALRTQVAAVAPAAAPPALGAGDGATEAETEAKAGALLLQRQASGVGACGLRAGTASATNALGLVPPTPATSCKLQRLGADGAARPVRRLRPDPLPSPLLPSAAAAAAAAASATATTASPTAAAAPGVRFDADSGVPSSPSSSPAIDASKRFIGRTPGAKKARALLAAAGTPPPSGGRRGGGGGGSKNPASASARKQRSARKTAGAAGAALAPSNSAVNPPARATTAGKGSGMPLADASPCDGAENDAAVAAAASPALSEVGPLSVAAPRRLSYSHLTPATHQRFKTPRMVAAEKLGMATANTKAGAGGGGGPLGMSIHANAGVGVTPAAQVVARVPGHAVVDGGSGSSAEGGSGGAPGTGAPLSVAALMARMQRLQSAKGSAQR